VGERRAERERMKESEREELSERDELQGERGAQTVVEQASSLCSKHRQDDGATIYLIS
jgi:hypothetical protein